MCVIVLTGCGKENAGGKDDGGSGTVSSAATGEAAPTDTPTPTATSSPTPTVPYVKQAYETYGREDVYRVPVQEFTEDWFLMDAICAGDSVLLWLWPPESDDDTYEVSSTFVMTEPGVSGEQHRMTISYSVTEPKLLSNGTLVLEDRDTGRIHVFDKTLAERKDFSISGSTISALIGVSEDGRVWKSDVDKCKLMAFDLQGQPAGEYAYDPKYHVTQYLGCEGGCDIFVGTLEDMFTFDYLYVPRDGSEVFYRGENETALGEDWKFDWISPMRLPDTTDAEAMWFVHAPGSFRDGYAFPKAAPKEGAGVWEDGKMCSISGYSVDDENYVRDFRMYDLVGRTVSGVLSDSEIPDCTYLALKGVIGSGDVVFVLDRESGGKELLLWTAREQMSPIAGFCEMTKEGLEEGLSMLLQEAETYGITFTPDRTEDDGTLASLGDFLAEMEFVNTFILVAKSNPDLVKPKSGTVLHPENMRNNDGAGYTFNPHVFSTFYRKEHGEILQSVFFDYVDAVRAGEDRFRCPDDAGANWSSGRFATMFFPVAGLYVDAEYVGNGWAEITYKIPKEEFLAKEREFEEKIVEILNDVLEEDYTDLEKALALYEFMTEYCVYDYEMLAHNEEDEWTDRQSGYRALTEKQGICWEIAVLYQFLGLQCGIDMDEVVGAPVDPDQDLHAWDYLCLDGQGYLIDATWGLTTNRKPDLKYFLFTDELREDRDGYRKDSCDVGFEGLYGARKKFSFDADDERYGDLWSGKYLAFDEGEKCIFYWDAGGDLKRFDFGE